MELSPRQWLIIGALIVGFAIAAIVARGDGTREPDFDSAAWCSGAQGLAGLEPLFAGTAQSATAGDYDAAKEALYAVETTAPFELRDAVNFLSDFAFVAGQQFEVFDWPEAYDAARDNTDTAVVDESIVELDRELQACGVSFAG
ncbi:MAG: hypothetical protein R8F63_03365 [Acidimicrobiales bacterium]|nr:hypothetical protein [Acidimicrobiales bacterium]